MLASNGMNIAVIGYPYTRQNYRAVFESPNVYFILPKIWKIKDGKAEYRTENSSHIITTIAPFYHSHYPIIGGLLKGLMPAFPWLLWKLKREHNIKLVFEAHESTLLTTLYHGFFVKLFGMKHIVFSWENIPFSEKFSGIKGIIHELILRLNLLFSDAVVCGNTKCLDIFRALTNKPLARIPLAGLDPEKFKPLAIRSDHEDITFIFAGAIDRRKGLHVLLPAFKKVLDTIPSAKLVLVGSGTYEKEIALQVVDLNLPVTRISWTNHANLIDILSRGDIFVYPSIAHGGWEEQFGYSIAEASLMELPIIATKSGSINEVVLDGKTGILVEANNIQKLADAMTKLASNTSLCHEYGTTGRQYIMNNFSNGKIKECFATFFFSIQS